MNSKKIKSDSKDLNKFKINKIYNKIKLMDLSFNHKFKIIIK